MSKELSEIGLIKDCPDCTVLNGLCYFHELYGEPKQNKMNQQVTPEAIIPNDKMISAFGHSNFGTQPLRDVLKEGLIKICKGYHNGRTCTCILLELGLVIENGKNIYALTDIGFQYLQASLAQPINDGWIRVEDRLPNREDADEYGSVDILCLCSDNTYNRSNARFDSLEGRSTVIYWATPRPLPPAPINK